MPKKSLFFSAVLLISLLFAGTAKAVCPVCVVAVGAGLGFSRWLGVDDVVSSVWIGGLLASLSMWTLVWLKRKGWGFKFDTAVVWIAYYGLTLVPLYFADIVGHPLNKIFGIDKIIFGAIAGTVIFLASVTAHNFLKAKNAGKSFFPYQKVVVPVLLLAVASSAFYFYLK